MAQHRRASTQGGSIQRQSLGEPYQIYTEVVNAGKNLEGSKRKVKWLFGFTESDSEHEVVLIHSLVSGKKTITEDGKEISSSSNIFATDFSHGWSSETCHRLFRIEASIGLTSEHLYTFSIDGVKFIDMPRKPLSSGHAPKQPFSSDGGAHRRSSTGDVPRNASFSQQQPRSNFQSPFAPSTNNNNSNNSTSSNSFDPFAANGEAEFDPFGEHSAPAANKKTTPTANKVTPTQKPAKSSQQSAATSLFGSFDDDSQSSQSFDPFGSAPASNAPHSDPFASHTQTHSTPSNAHHQTAAPKKLEPKKTPVAEPDLFGNFDQPITTSPAQNDLFASPANNTSKPQRRSSAQEISMDFAGMSFVAPPAASPPKPTRGVVETVVVPPQPVEEEPRAKDPWDATKGLVDLDLTGRNAQPQRRTSVSSQGPTLDNLMGVQPAGGRRSSFTNGSASGMANPVDPFAAPPRPVSMYGNQMGGGFGPGMGMPPPPAAPVYGRGLGAPPQPGFQSGPGMLQPQPNNTRGSMGGMPPANTLYGGGYSQQGQQQGQGAQKSSLDTLNWKM